MAEAFGGHTQTHGALRIHFTWESVRASRVTRRDTRQERAHSVEQHRNAFSSRQSFTEMDTVADRLASLSFQKGKRVQKKKMKHWKSKVGRQAIYRSHKRNILNMGLQPLGFLKIVNVQVFVSCTHNMYPTSDGYLKSYKSGVEV